MHRDKLTGYLIKLLKPEEFSDSCPNGLQVEGKDDINKIITGVSASVELFEWAIGENADAIIVHHGIIWDFERPLYVGAYKERIGLLLKNNLNLYAFHLPLDVHPQIGNNIKLAGLLGVKKTQLFGEYKGQNIGIQGMINPINKDKFFVKMENILQRKPLIFPYGPEKIKSVAIITGGAQKYIKQAVAKNIDAYITGEVSEYIMHYTKEEKIHFISAGHYATEKFGVIALGEELEKKFKIKVKFIDIPNPV
jgi:dinuclear metal center YbgI/SA1388 family protein